MINRASVTQLPLTTTTFYHIKTSGNAPPIWRTFPQSADFSSKLEDVSAASGLLLQTGGRFRSQRIVPALLRGLSTGVENALHFCSKVSTTVKNVLHFCSKVFTGVESVLHFCSKVSTAVNASHTFAGAFLLQYFAPAEVRQHFYTTFCGKIISFVLSR